MRVDYKYLPNCPQPWLAKTAVMTLPLIYTEENSEEMTALMG